MKNSNKCPKCGGEKIRYQPGGKLQGQDNMIAGFLGPVIRIGRYFCLDCGFTEEWIDDLDGVQDL